MPEEIKQSKPDQLQRGASERRPQEPELGQMPDEPAIGRIEHAMPSRPEETSTMVGGDLVLMTPFDAAAAREASQESRDRAKIGEMKPHPSSTAGAGGRESYLRLLVRVVRDRMTIVRAVEVDGPLALPRQAAGGHVYEVTLDGRTVAADGLPDLGVSRSLPRPGEHEHHIAERATFEFNVRIPRDALRTESIGRLSLALFRFADSGPKKLEGGIAAAFGSQARRVAAIETLRSDALAPVAREQLDRLFPRWEETVGEPPSRDQKLHEESRAGWLRALIRAIMALLGRLTGTRRGA